MRNEALDSLSGIISSAKFITDNLGDLPNPFKARLTDANKNLATRALQLGTSLAEALGPGCKPHGRNLIPSIIQALADAKVCLSSTVCFSVR